MNKETLSDILKNVADGTLTPDEASQRLRMAPYEDMNFAKIDLNRELRTGRPEVVFCKGKTPEHTAAIFRRLFAASDLVLGTKAATAHWEAVRDALTAENTEMGISYDAECAEMKIEISYDAEAQFIVARRGALPARDPEKLVAVVTAGTADIPIAEEAARTAELYGHEVLRVYDVGVAGLHRLLDRVAEIRTARAVVVVAGMEGALASVVGGLVDRPVVAVPTSVGYGASMGGFTALLAMLNSCSLGVSVMNIDNGFGAGHLASMIAE